jgi:hypothetical protein
MKCSRGVFAIVFRSIIFLLQETSHYGNRRTAVRLEEMEAKTPAFGRGLAVAVGVHPAGNFRRNSFGYVVEESMTCAAKSCCASIRPGTPDTYLPSSRAPQRLRPRQSAKRRPRADSGGRREGALVGVWIGAVLHPAVLLALANGAGVLQHGDRPSTQRADRRSPLFHHQHRNHPARHESLSQSIHSSC